MKLPVLQKLTVNDFSPEALEQVFIKNSVDKVPCYLSLEDQDIEQAENALQNIKEVLAELEIHPRLPYPLYIICPLVEHFEDLMIINSEQDIARHFKKKFKRTNNREQALLTKSEISLEKISNHNINEDHIYIALHSDENKELRDLSFELNFYQQIEQNISNATNPESDGKDIHE